MFLTNVAYASAEHGASAPLFHIGPLEVTSEITTMWGVMLLIVVVCFLGTRNMQRIPSGLQNVLEYGIEMYENFFSDILGRKRARRFMPLLASFFICFVFQLLRYAAVGRHTARLKPPTST